MKRTASILPLILIVFLLFSLTSCKERTAGNGETFVETAEGTLIGPDGTEYAFLANEGSLYYLGELEFYAYVEGEAHEHFHLGVAFQTGMFSIKGDDTRNVLVRERPDSEWFSLYRKASLPDFDYSIDNCTRLELVPDSWHTIGEHVACGGGITDSEEIRAFLSDIRSQKSATEAGLYNLVKQPAGFYKNCYGLGEVYGFFEGEPCLALCLYVTSFDDQAHSIGLDHVDRVLPEEWLPRLLAHESASPEG